MEHFIWNVDPNIFTIGSIQVRWYGVLFVGSFLIGLQILHWVYRREKRDDALLDNLLFFIIIGAIVGSRLVHCFFYAPDYYLAHPLQVFAVWKGGLASHGGLAGVLIALYFYTKRYKIDYFWLLARLTIPGALTAAFVRIGNLFNSEILGLPSDAAWAVVFPKVDMIARHPVQLYEAGAYLLIVVLLLSIYKKVSPEFATKILPGTFLITLFSARFLIEYTKTEQAAYTTDIALTTGQMLSIPFIIAGVVWIVWAFRSAKKPAKRK